MPLYSFATYVDARDEWAINADDLAHARRLIGDDPCGEWINDAIHIDTDAVDCRSEFATGLDGRPAVEEITPDHWAWRAAHRDAIDHLLRQNIAAIAAELHTHRLYGIFYEKLGASINGFTGIYDFCIAMAQALTEWEAGHGLGEAYERVGVEWIEIVEAFVEAVIVTAVESGEVPDAAQILRGLDGCQKDPLC